jgi:hypothetical protein
LELRSTINHARSPCYVSKFSPQKKILSLTVKLTASLNVPVKALLGIGNRSLINVQGITTSLKVGTLARATLKQTASLNVSVQASLNTGSYYIVNVQRLTTLYT